MRATVKHETKRKERNRWPSEQLGISSLISDRNTAALNLGCGSSRLLIESRKLLTAPSAPSPAGLGPSGF